MTHIVRKNSGHYFSVLVFYFWVAVCHANQSNQYDKRNPVTMLAALLIAITLEHDPCQVWVLPGDSEDLALKAALHPSCTLIVSGTYQLRTAIALYNNKIFGSSALQYKRYLPKANEQDLIAFAERENTYEIPLEERQRIQVGAIFIPGDDFSGTYLFQSWGNHSFHNIGVPKNSVDPTQNLRSSVGISNDIPYSQFIDIGLVDPADQTCPDDLPGILQWGKKGRQKSYSQPRKGHSDGTRSGKGPYQAPASAGHPQKKPRAIEGGGQPPKRPGRWDKKTPNIVDEMAVAIILQLVSEVLSGQNVTQNLSTIREMLKTANPNTCQRLMEHPDFIAVNKTHQLLIGYSRKTQKK